jgi:hypothetical protein
MRAAVPSRIALRRPSTGRSGVNDQLAYATSLEKNGSGTPLFR